MTDVRVRVGGAVQYVADLPAGGNDVGDRRIVLEPPAGAESTTYRWDGTAWVPENAPLSGTLRLYVDGTNGDDTAQGTSWAEAWKTLAFAQSRIEQILATNPTNLYILVFLRGTFTSQSLRVRPNGSVLVYVGQQVSDMTSIRSGTVSAVGGEAGPPKHGLERVTLAGAALDGTEVGMTLVLSDPLLGSIGSSTILRVDPVNQYVWTTQLIGEFPAWVAASPANAVVVVPSAYVDGQVEMSGSPLYLGPAGTALTQATSMCMNIRTSGAVYMRGSNIGICGCYCRSLAGTWQRIYSSGADAMAGYYRAGSAYTVDDWVLEEFGLIAGPSPVVKNTLGNAARSLSVSGGNVSFYGYLSESAAMSTTPQSCTLTRCSLTCVMQSYLGRSQLFNALARGHATNGIAYCRENGSVYVAKTTLVDLPATGLSCVFDARRGGEVWYEADSVEGVNTGTGTCNGLVARSGGMIWAKNASTGILAVKHSFVSVEGDGEVQFDSSVTLGASLGSAPDVSVVAGSVVFGGNVTKSATNPSGGGGTAQPVLQCRRGAKVTQAAGSTFTLPAGSGNNTTDYGANGAIDIETCCDVALGLLAGGNAVATNTAVRVKKASRLAHAGAAPAWGAAALDQGGNAAAAMPAAVTSDMAAGVPEDCWVLPGSA